MLTTLLLLLLLMMMRGCCSCCCCCCCTASLAAVAEVRHVPRLIGDLVDLAATCGMPPSRVLSCALCGRRVVVVVLQDSMVLMMLDASCCSGT